MSTFLSEYLRHTSIYESPISFWKWSAYASIAAILRDTCYLPQGESRLYANLYILLLAESSIHRKGAPVALSETLVSKINNTKIISGRSSIEAILDELARTETDKHTGRVKKSSSAIFYAPEMAAGIVASQEGLKILTDIYDYKTNPYKSRLRTGPCFNLEGVVFSMLSASNEAMLKGLFGESEIHGGFLARTLLVSPNEEREPNSLMRLSTDERRASLECVQFKLTELRQLNGAFTLEEDAIDEYETWYGPFKKSYQKKKEVTGIVGRIHTTIVKMSMILAANEGRLDIRKEHVEEAIEECLGLIPNYSTFTMTRGKTESGQAGGLIVTSLLEAKEHLLGHKELVRKHWQDFDADMLDKVITTLETAGMIRRHMMPERGGLAYQLTDIALEMLERGKK